MEYQEPLLKCCRLFNNMQKKFDTLADHALEQYAQKDPIVLFKNKQNVYVYKENTLEGNAPKY